MTPLTLVKLINRTYPLLCNFFIAFFFSLLVSLFCCVRGGGCGGEVRRVEMGCVKVKEIFWVE